MLQVLANKTAPFKKVVGEVNYGSMTSKEALRYRQEILYNSEGMFVICIEILVLMLLQRMLTSLP